MNTNVSPAGSTPTHADYLAFTSLTDNIFLVGVLDSGVTIFNQQVRALNLIWALDRAKQLDSASEIAVVGGGIAGLTAAMALRKIFSLTADSPHQRVTLFEQRSVLCPLQRGCATRWVHPHIYNWPEAGSTNPSAGLPIMNWRAGRASDVATTIVNEWESERSDNVEEWRNLQYLKIDHRNREIEWVGEQYSYGIGSSEIRGSKQQFDIIILAIGFGGELGSEKYPAVSYWRNETYGQPDLSGRQQRYLVSGTGDGGLVDLLRLRIADFREDRIGHQLAPEGSKRYKAIQTLRNTCYNDPSAQGAELFDRARQSGRELGLINEIKQRLRADTMASLQIQRGRRVSDAFGGKSSFVNRFLVSLLFEAGGFSPQFGDLEKVDGHGFDQVIVRHGTRSEAQLTSIFSEDISNLLANLKKTRHEKTIPGVRQGAGLWETGWPLDRKRGPGPGSAKHDFVPGATIAVSSAFVSALAPVFSARGERYRATLHRVVAMRGAHEIVHLQQIANYHGPRASKSTDNVIGRLFNISDAVIGLAARSGRVLITRVLAESPDDCKRLLREDMQRLGGDHWDPKRMDDEVSALFACPLLSESEAANSVKTARVVAVLFADSTEVAAFDEETVTQIVAACQEFGRYLQRIAQRQAEGQATEVISVESQATCYTTDDSDSEMFKDFSVLTALPIPAPKVPVDYINLDWWT